MPDKYLIGIDLGGTKVAAAAFGLDGNRLGNVARLPTMAARPSQFTLLNLNRVVKQARAEAGVEGKPVAIGMGSSGPLDPARGVLLDRDSLPHLVGFNIGRYCADTFGAPLWLENDAACFALGEAVHGAGKSEEIVVGITLGTGFGCGITIGGRVHVGATSNAGEVAYCKVSGSDYDNACSGVGVKRQYRAAAGPDADLGLDAKSICDLARNDHPAALQAMTGFGADVGTAIGTICCVIDPSIVVLGGSVAQAMPLFEAPMMEAARGILAAPAGEALRIVPAALGSASGLTGAMEFARQRMGQ